MKNNQKQSKIIILEGTSKKGKERIRRHGDIWNIIRESFVQFAPDLHILVMSEKTSSLRWIKDNQDKDFKIKLS